MVNVTQGFISVGGGSSVSGDSAPPPPPNLGAANFRKDIDLGLAQSITLEMRQAQDVGFSAGQAPATLLTAESLGLSVDTFASGTAKPEQTTGLTMGSVLVMNNLPEKNAGFQMQQTWNYVGTKWVATATNTVGDAWSNPNNALGANDGSSATRSGQALSSTDGTIEFTHDAVGLKDSLTIDKVELIYYHSLSGVVLGNGTLSLQWRIAPSVGWSTLVTHNSSVNFIASGQTFDITGSIADWDDIRNIETRARATMNLGAATVTASIDAVRINIEASLIE